MLQIRPANRTDCAELAILDDLGSQGLAQYVWAKDSRDNRVTPFEHGRNLLMEDSDAYSWRNATVAEKDGEILGMILGYEMPEDVKGTEDPVLSPLAYLQVKSAGNWYLDTLAVYARARGNGIGRQLLQSECGKAGKRTISVVTEDDNVRALSLYSSEGFDEVERRKQVKFSDSNSREWVLLTRPA